jgi:hypothetical protein
MRSTQVICDQCGADITSDTQDTVEQAETKIGEVSYIIERRITAISRLDDGKSHDICKMCRLAVLKTPLTKEFSAMSKPVLL